MYYFAGKFSQYEIPGQKYAMVLLLEDTDCWLPRGDRLVARVGPRLGARVG